MQGLRLADGTILYDANGVPVGIMGLDGKEYLIPSTANTASGTSQPPATYPSSVAITGGTINGTPIGGTTPAAVKASDFQANRTDSSGTPGNATINTPRGRAAFAAAGSSVVITNSLVTATSTVLVQLGGADATLTTVRVTAAAGSFTVTGNAAATGTTPFDFLVIN